MIIDRNESEVTVLGEVQKYKVSIDEKNLNHIVTILSSNLYSHPMQSFLREIVSNAVDSHKEAGVDEPVIITITDNDLAIRDFGTGISPERFREIFINIGSSTKRESNEYIGSWGIGRFSSLSVSDLVNITSFYEGKAYYYVMNKDIDQLHIDLLFEKDTDENNGVEVKIPFRKALNPNDWLGLAFFPNIYIEDARTAFRESPAVPRKFNERKIYAYDSFKLLDADYPLRCNSSPSVLIGNVRYDVDLKAFMDDGILNEWDDTFNYISPQLAIGDVDVTPNRESLLYSEKTKKALTGIYNTCIEELKRRWDDQCNTQAPNLRTFMENIIRHYYNELKLGTVVQLPSSLPYKMKYHHLEDIPYKELEMVCRQFWNQRAGLIGIVEDGYEGIRKGEKHRDNSLGQILLRMEGSDNKVIVVPDAAGLSSKYIVGFLKEQYPGKTIYLIRERKVSMRRIMEFIRSNVGITTASSPSKCIYYVKVLREIFSTFKHDAVYKDIIHSPKYLRYKEENREDTAYQRDKNKLTFHVWTGSKYDNETVKTVTVSELLKWRKVYQPKKRTVYCSINNPFILALQQVSYPNLLILALSESTLRQVERDNLLPSWIKPIESIYDPNNRALQRLATMDYIRRNMPLVTARKQFREDIYSAHNRLNELRGKISSVSPDQVAYSLIELVPKEKYDLELMALYNTVMPHIDILKRLDRNYHISTLEWYFLMKAKRVRINWDTYSAARSEINEIVNI